MNYLGKYLKKRLKELKMSEREVSSKCGISHSYLNQLIKGVNPSTRKNISPTLATFEKLGKGFGVSIEHLQKIARGQVDYNKNSRKKFLDENYAEYPPEMIKQIKDFQDFMMEIGFDKSKKTEKEWCSIIAGIKEIVEKRILLEDSKTQSHKIKR